MRPPFGGAPPGPPRKSASAASRNTASRDPAVQNAAVQNAAVQNAAVQNAADWNVADWNVADWNTAARNTAARILEETMRGLTEKQEAILSYIADSIADLGRFPSYRDIGREFGLNSVATVAQHLRALVEKGFLIRQGRKLLPTPGIRRDRGIPIVGRVAAGRPVSAIEHYEGTLGWDDLGRTGTFAVRVVGDSMIDEGILPGDFAIVQPGDTARNGDLVVAYLGEDQEVTVKRFHRRAGQVELRPANAKYRPIRIDRKDSFFRLAGRVVGIVRRT